MEEPEDSFVGQDMQNVAGLRIDDRQPVDLVFQQGVDGVEETEVRQHRVRAAPSDWASVVASVTLAWPVEKC